LIGYPLLVAASGLFFRVRLVLFTMGVTLAAYIVLMILRPEEAHPVHYPVIYAMTLVVIGLVVAHQVHRVRALSRYYDRRSVS
jgi:serine/threonine-protein kinase